MPHTFMFQEKCCPDSEDFLSVMMPYFALR